MINRRDVLKATSAAAVYGTVASSTSVAGEVSDNKAVLNVGGYDYDRVRAIIDGKVEVPGYSMQFETSDIYSLSRSAFGTDKKYDVTEIGLLPFIGRYINQQFRDYVLIPVFISRTFRHRNVYVRADSGIEKPEDLRGKKVGTPGYGFSAHTWIRGFLNDEFGVKPEEMEWIETTESSDGGAVSQKLDRRYLDDSFPLVKGPPGVDESELLISGGCDALITAITPNAFLHGNPKIRQLFPNIRAAEQAYYEKTKIFPIMHAVALRAELAKADPELPKALFELYSQAKSAAYQNLATTTSLKVTLPWVTQEFEDTRTLMGDNYWPYGVEANRKELELAMRYSHEQGLTKKLIGFEELFHPSTLALSEAS
jgi:4,5-dihydroxyphthalate decarboxylase